MRKMTEAETRKSNGGIWWGWVMPYTKAVARARLIYEHKTSGHCYTKYPGIHCPICGR